jgi:hypothetical protein
MTPFTESVDEAKAAPEQYLLAMTLAACDEVAHEIFVNRDSRSTKTCHFSGCKRAAYR